MDKNIIKQEIRAMADKWPSTIVSRGEVGKFSGGFVHPRTMANLDSRGEGPSGRVRIGKKSGYTVPTLIDWLITRVDAS